MDAVWPKTVFFDRDRLNLSFASAAEFGDWVGREAAFWSPMISGVAPGHFNQLNANVGALNNVQRNRTEEAIAQFASDYRTSSGPLGRVISRLPNNTEKCIAFAEAIQPGSSGVQPTEEAPVLRRAIGHMFNSLGEDALSLPLIKAAIEEVQKIRESDKGTLDRFNALIGKAENDWSNKIEGYEAKVALSAPRSFWSTRAEHNRRIAAQDRNKLFLSTIAMLLFVLAAASGELLFGLPSNFADKIVSGVTRLVLFATVLAVAAWWLKQKLRDVRFHEHLAEDAAERATMIETYAAMRGAGLQDTDLAPILSALYRPAISGLNEDMGPILPTELIIRGIAAAAAKEK